MPGLGDHGVGVDLAHVVALVLGLDVPDVEAPGVVAVVDDVEPVDMNGQRETSRGLVESSNLGILVMTCRPMVRIICRSMWTQATCEEQKITTDVIISQPLSLCLMRFAHSLFSC